MSNLWFGVILIGIFQIITLTNCEPLVQIAKLPKSHPSVQKIIQKKSGGTVPEVATTVGDDTVPDVAPIVGDETVPDVAPIVGGDAAQEFAIPWQVLYIYFPYNNAVQNVWLCGGTIINKRTILTAAHCTDIDPEQKEGYFFGAAGWFNTTTDPSLPPAQIFDIEDVRQHKGYKKTEKTIYNDIALLITHDDLDFSTPAVQPVPCLANRKLDYLATCTRNDNCVTAGYGVYQQNITGSQPPVVSPTGEVVDGVTPDELHVLEGTNLVHYTACWKALRGTGLTVLPTNICALDKDQGFCFGDSGGFNGCEYKNGVFYQVGIPSWITSRDCSVGIQVFTRVAKYLRWIVYYKYK